MRTYKLDGNKKIMMKNFTFDMATTLQDSLMQKLKLKFMFVLGEYWLDIEKGLPYFDKEDGQIAIFNKSADLNTIISTLKEHLLDTEGVKEILSFTFNIDNGYRTATINFNVKTTTNDIVIGEIVI